MALSHNYDYDYFQPYFYYDQEEEPFDPQLQPPVPSEDIWKKFQLLPAPPTPRLRYKQRITCEAHSFQSFPVPIIHQDCMWSSFSSSATLASRKEPAGFKTLNSRHLQDSNPSTLESIDPSLIFPEAPKHSARMKHRQEAPPSSGSCCTDSGSNEEEDQEEEEEPDLGVVPKRQAGRRCGPRLFILKRRHIFTKQHNYAACPSRRHKQAATKRLKLHVQLVG